MKRGSLLFALPHLLVLVLTLSSCAPRVSSAEKLSHPPLHLPPDASTEQLKKSLDVMSDETKDKKTSPEDEAFFELAFKVGSRLNLWIKNINAERPSDEALSLWTPETTRAISIDSPREKTHYSMTSAKAAVNALRTTAPKEMVGVIFGDDTVPSQMMGVSEVEFLTWGREFDRAYQTAMRLKMLLPFIDWYKENRSRDVRGYYFLNKMSDRRQKLSNFSGLSSVEQADITSWLVSICLNGGESLQDCQETLRKQIVGAFDLNPFYFNYEKAAQETWSAYFNIDSNDARHDIAWSNEAPMIARIPFLKTPIAEVNDYLTVNIQDEWKWAGWQLELAFQDQGSNIPFVVFESGATPHVSGLGGNQITMDALANLQGWDSRWTIRHEFGHVLGLPDCYAEFFEEESGDMVNYQLDIEDLMCSRRGKLKERHYLEMKRVYGPGSG